MHKRFTLTILLLISVVLIAPAESIKHIDAKTFIKLADLIEHPTSVFSATFVGATQSRAYLEHLSVITWAHIFHLKEEPTCTLYWTELDQLPLTTLNQIKKRNPAQNPKASPRLNPSTTPEATNSINWLKNEELKRYQN